MPVESSSGEAIDHDALQQLRRYLDGGVEDQVAERVAAKRAAMKAAAQNAEAGPVRAG